MFLTRFLEPVFEGDKCLFETYNGIRRDYYLVKFTGFDRYDPTAYGHKPNLKLGLIVEGIFKRDSSIMPGAYELEHSWIIKAYN